tara:strand:+ start:1557 stop:1982 length:426 start_codon:yes stop_codon:yes gene_type:complete
MAAANLNTIRSTIESRLQSELKDGRPIPVIFHNLSYTPPSNSAWCQCLVSFGTSSYQTLGGATDSTNSLTGTIAVNIFTPKGKGSGENFKIAKRIRDLYNRIIVSGVSFDPPIGPQVLEVSLPEGYFQTQIRVSFDVYEDL